MNQTATPMTVRCTECNQPQVQPSTAMSIMAWRADADITCAFTCIWCDEVVCKPLHYCLYRSLRHIVPTYLMEPVLEVMEERTGPAINHDDVLRLHQELNGWRNS